MAKQTFKDKVVVVTGGASGIGLALCQKFGAMGAKIALLDMAEEAVNQTKQELSAQGVTSMGLVCDVTCESQCTAAMEKIINQFGGVDVLVNNAGITQRSAFVDTAVHVYRKVMAVNFFGSLYCTKACINSIVQRKGMILVIESLAGVTPLYGRTGYSASKHALHGLFTSLRTEIRAAGAHVMIVCPGFIRTNLQTRALGADGTVTGHPQSFVGRQDSPEHAADLICRAAGKRKNILVLTPVGKMAYWISRITPVLYERIMARQLRNELR